MAETKIEVGMGFKIGRGPGSYRPSDSTLTYMYDRCGEFRCGLG